MTKINNNGLWFILGSFPEISAAEISAVLSIDQKNYLYQPPFLIVNKEIGIDSKKLISRLGGTVKIAEHLFDSKNEEDLIYLIFTNLKDIAGKIHFGISYYDDSHKNAKFPEKIGMEVKKHLKQSGLSARFVFNREAVLSSVTVQKNGLVERGREYIIKKNEDGFSVAKTLAVQPFEEWGERDFGRPERDDLSGMLPPKLARIMLNLALINEKDAVLDPFCGSGTIISEALSIGIKKIIGSDISEKAISDTKTNIEWLKSHHKEYEEAGLQLLVSDIESLPKLLKTGLVNAIVTEPFLGKPLKGNETENELQKQTNDLSALYCRAFTSFSKLLRKDGSLLIIIPRFRTKNGWIRLNIAKCIAEAGFSADVIFKTESRSFDSLLYARPYQRVGREIWRFRKN